MLPPSLFELRTGKLECKFPDECEGSTRNTRTSVDDRTLPLAPVRPTKDVAGDCH